MTSSLPDLPTIAKEIFSVGAHVRYVAVRTNDELHLQERSGIAIASSAESDRYEELLVNPTLLTLTQQRGDIDCGGLRFVLVGYGEFSQLVLPAPTGHVSVALESDAVTIGGLQQIVEIVAEASRRPHS
jgi:hypothetical protein